MKKGTKVICIDVWEATKCTDRINLPIIGNEYTIVDFIHYDNSEYESVKVAKIDNKHLSNEFDGQEPYFPIMWFADPNTVDIHILMDELSIAHS